jgi:hypothetical protein
LTYLSINPPEMKTVKNESGLRSLLLPNVRPPDKPSQRILLSFKTTHFAKALWSS